MNVLNTPRLFAGSMLIAIILSGCATPRQIPDLLQPQSSGLAIQVTLKAPVGIFSNSPSQIYFAKIDGEGGMLQQSIIRSNYVKNDRAYLLNAQPGTYAAVAAFFLRAVGTGRTRYTTYFSKELTEQTKVTIGTNDFVFIGNYVVDQSVGLAGADAVQLHYQNVISPGATTGGFLHLMGGDYHYRGTLIERKYDDQTRNEFVRNAKEDLAGSGWAARVK